MSKWRQGSSINKFSVGNYTENIIDYVAYLNNNKAYLLQVGNTQLSWSTSTNGGSSWTQQWRVNPPRFISEVVESRTYTYTRSPYVVDLFIATFSSNVGVFFLEFRSNTVYIKTIVSQGFTASNNGANATITNSQGPSIGATIFRLSDQ